MPRKRVAVPDCLKWTFEDLDRELAEMCREEEDRQMHLAKAKFSRRYAERECPHKQSLRQEAIDSVNRQRTYLRERNATIPGSINSKRLLSEETDLECSSLSCGKGHPEKRSELSAIYQARMNDSMVELKGCSTPINSRIQSLSNIRSPTGSFLARGQDFLSSIFKYNQRKDTFERVNFKNPVRNLSRTFSFRK